MTQQKNSLFIESGSLPENGYIESFSGKLRDEFLNGQVFDTILESKVISERWRKTYNTIRQHSFFGISSAGAIGTVSGNGIF